MDNLLNKISSSPFDKSFLLDNGKNLPKQAGCIWVAIQQLSEVITIRKF